MRPADETRRGREAVRPREIAWLGWRDILLRLKEEIARDYLGLVAAGVAFYFLLALFPAMAAMVSVYGLLTDPAELAAQIDALHGLVPAQGLAALEAQLLQVVATSAEGLGFAMLFGLLFAIWSASKGARALIKGLNIAYDEQETRGFFRLTLLAFGLTLGGVLFAVFALGFVAVLPALLAVLPLPQQLMALILWARWLMLIVAVMLALALVYRYAPCRSSPRWAWSSWGAVFAAGLWLLSSAAFSVYVSNFGNFNETYGSVGAAVILMLWLFLTAFAVLLGAALNAEMEHQTRRDTMVGPERSMGERGAVKADHLGPRP